MRLVPLVRVAALTLAALSQAALADTDLYVLRRSDSALAIEKVHLIEGTDVTWTVGDKGFVDVILPPGPGGSAGIVQSAMRPTTVASCRDGKLSVITTLGSKRFDRPIPAADELRKLDIHLSARTGDGSTLSVFIRGYDRVEADRVGVVEDPFGTLIPLQPNDCVINTTTFVAREPHAAHVEGEAPVRHINGHHLARASVEGGAAGDLVIDCAAGITIIAKAALPDGTVITPSEMAQYSADGVRRLATEIGGATTAVVPLGLAKLSALVVGGITYRDVDALVMAEMPPVGDGVIGILGLDLLSRSRSVSLPYPKQGETGTMRVGASGSKGAAAVVPLTIVDSRAYCAATVNDAKAVLIVDSGSPITILDPRMAKSAGIVADRPSKDARGIGSGSAALRTGTAGTISLGGWVARDAAVRVGSLPLFARFQGPVSVGVLGNDTLSRCSRVEIDFETASMRLYE